MLKCPPPCGPILPISHRDGQGPRFQAASALSAQSGKGKNDFGAGITQAKQSS